jgi:cytochrome c-type biogenesis protein CcmH
MNTLSLFALINESTLRLVAHAIPVTPANAGVHGSVPASSSGATGLMDPGFRRGDSVAARSFAAAHLFALANEKTRNFSKSTASLSGRVKLTLLACLLSLSAHAIDALPFANRAEELRFQALTAELRCLQCRNQNLADSDAALAKDMRVQTLALMQRGDSDAQIKQHWAARYGDFVLYTPPFDWHNAALWLAPLLAALAGLSFVFWHFGREKTSQSANDGHKPPTADVDHDKPHAADAAGTKQNAADAAGDDW